MSKARDIADLDFNAPDIDGGNIDGATIGGTTPAAGSFSGLSSTGNITGTRIGLGGAPHATASLNLTNTDQHIRLNNGSELGVISLLSTGELDIWAHGEGETINFRTGAGTGIVGASLTGSTFDVGALTITSQGLTFNQAFGSGVPTITMTGTANNGRAGAINFRESDGAGGSIANTAAIYSTDGEGSNADYGGLNLTSYQNGITFATSALNSTKMKINTSGYVEMAGASQVRLTLGSQGTAGTNTSNWVRGNGTSFGYNSAGGDHAWEVSGTPRMTLKAGGDLEVPTGNVVISTAGKGVFFGGAAGNGGMTSQLLDDYEEGTWTPTLAGHYGNQGTTFNQGTRSGWYTKVGRIVTCQIQFSSAGVAAANNSDIICISGFPFSNTGSTATGASAHTSVSASQGGCWTFITGTTVAFLGNNGSVGSGWAWQTGTSWATAHCGVRLTITYTTT